MARSELTRQEKEDYCICAILQGILSEHGLYFSQDEIAANLSPTINGHLIYDKKIKDFLRLKGFDYKFYWHNETPFNEPDSLLEEICANDGFIGMGKHAYRVLAFTYPRIIVNDPEDARKKIINLQDLMRDLRKLDGGFGLIKKLDEIKDNLHNSIK